AVGQPRRPSAVVGQDRAGDDRRRRVAASLLHHHVDVVGSEHLERRSERRLGEGVRVDGKEERPRNALGVPLLDDRLARGDDMGLVEGTAQRRAPVPRGAEGDALGGIVRIGAARVVLGDEPRHVDEQLGRRRLSREGVESHRRSGVSRGPDRARRHRGEDRHSTILHVAPPVLPIDASFTGEKGAGKLLDDKAVSYRGALYYYSDSPNFRRLNSVAVVFEYNADADGNTKSKRSEEHTSELQSHLISYAAF